MEIAARLARGLRIAVVAVRRPLAARGPRRRGMLAAALIAIAIWQLGFSKHAAELDKSYAISAASGMHQDSQFVYFLYYLDQFPIATTLPNPELNEEFAHLLLQRMPGTLVQDLTWTWVSGDRGKVYLYLFDAWLKGAPWNPSVRPFHRLVFTLALCALFASFWWIRRPLLGGITVAFLGSNPFQLFEVHAHENVHGWTITTAILILAIHLPLVATRDPNRVDRRPWRWLLPAATGILLATIRTVRSEPAALIVSVLLTYLLLSDGWRRRALMSGLLIGFFALTNWYWNLWFQTRHDRAKELLTKVGGNPFPGPIRQHHHFWHPVWCGLGDFGEKHGYVWDDTKAVDYAKPILESKFHEHVPPSFGTDFGKEEYWDAKKIYRKLPYDVPHYSEVLRDKILSDIVHDPLWYLGVLAKRTWRIVSETTPVRLAWSAHWVELPMHGLVALLLAAFLFYARDRLLLFLVLFTMSTCLTPLLIYSGRGVSYYGIYHLLAAAILTTVLIENVRLWIARKRARR